VPPGKQGIVTFVAVGVSDDAPQRAIG
jgi:hypothetical protein